jgi:hypothetical protein
MCAVPNMAVLCSFGMWLRLLLKDFEFQVYVLGTYQQPVTSCLPTVQWMQPATLLCLLLSSEGTSFVHPATICLSLSALQHSLYLLSVASWCSSDDNAYCVLDLGLLLNSPFLPLGLRYVTPGGFLHLLMVIQGHARIVHVLLSSYEFLYLHIFNAGLSWFLIFGQVSCFISLLLLLLLLLVQGGSNMTGTDFFKP